MIYNLKIAEKAFKVDVGDVNNNIARVVVNGVPYSVKIENSWETGPLPKETEPSQSAPMQPKPVAKVSKTGAGVILAPIPGLILDIKVKVGDAVSKGQVVAIMEAMKMENDILAPISWIVQEISAQKGADVSTGDVIMVIA